MFSTGEPQRGADECTCVGHVPSVERLARRETRVRRARSGLEQLERRQWARLAAAARHAHVRRRHALPLPQSTLPLTLSGRTERRDAFQLLSARVLQPRGRQIGV